MRCDLAFGKTGITVNLPAGFHYRLLEARSSTPIADWAGALEAALDKPIGRPPLMEVARGKKSAAISICDITRPAPNSKTLPPILRRLEAAGIARENITLLIATGLHRPATPEEIREICGDQIAAAYTVVNHDARDLGSHRHLGNSSTGTPVYIDARFIASDLHITLGFIEPHLMLGFSGARKLIAPGLAAQETIKVLHSPKFMRDARSKEGSIFDNPLHHELLEIARLARHDFMLDVVLARDRNIAGVFAGDPEEAHRQGVAMVSEATMQTLDEPVDAVITTSAGYPLDLTYYQAIKGVTAAQHILKPGAPILLCAACSEGAGAPEFRNMVLDGRTDQEFLDHIANAPVTVDQWQLEKLAMVSTRHPVSWYVPGLPSDCSAKVWGTVHSSVEAAIASLTARLRPGATIAVIPEGPYVLARSA